MPLVSVVVPTYNAVRKIESTVASLLAQTLSGEQLEILLVDDGSTDSTPQVIEKLAARYASIRALPLKHGGVSSARNAGIDAASGRYLTFVDAGDVLLPDTLEAAASMFAAHEDEIDMLCLPMLIVENGKQKPHVREQVLTHTGVYDVAKLCHAFAQVTNVNVMVKNTPDLPRFREDLKVHEDLVFNLEVILRREKVGFSQAGAYVYLRERTSAGRVNMAPQQQFEQNMTFWEELFERFADAQGKAPLYLQASYMTELVWKIKADLLFPRHLPVDEEVAGRARLARLLDAVDDDAIWCVPRAHEYLKNYFYGLKHSTRTRLDLNERGFTLWDGETLLLCRRAVKVCLDPSRAYFDGFDGGRVCSLTSSAGGNIVGTLESVAFSYLDERTGTEAQQSQLTCVCILPDGKRIPLQVCRIVELPERKRSRRGVTGKERISDFYQFELPAEVLPTRTRGTGDLRHLSFEVVIDGVPLAATVFVLPKGHGKLWMFLRRVKRYLWQTAYRLRYKRRYTLPH